jgi:hypothetical protein
MQTNELMSYNRSIRVGSVKNLVPALNISTFAHFVKRSEIGILLVEVLRLYHQLLRYHHD